MKICSLLLAATACADSAEPYLIEAVANLEALGGAAVSGPLELLDQAGASDEQREAGLRTFAAYDVALPDTAPRRVLIYDATACDAPRDELRVLADLATIRRIGGRTHFFLDELDTEFIYAFVSLDPDGFFPIGGKIVIVQELDREDGAPGEWLACGAFPAR